MGRGARVRKGGPGGGGGQVRGRGQVIEGLVRGGAGEGRKGGRTSR